MRGGLVWARQHTRHRGCDDPLGDPQGDLLGSLPVQQETGASAWERRALRSMTVLQPVLTIPTLASS